MTINCVIIDDEPGNIAMIVEAVADIYDVEIEKTYESPKLFLREYKKLDFELCIIDYHLPDMDGLECARKLINKKVILASPKVIPADEALEHEAVVDVIRITKPFNKQRITKAIKKVRDELLMERGFVVFKTHKSSYQRFSFKDIVFITSDPEDPRRKLIYSSEESRPIRTQEYTIDRLLNKLPKDLFCQINKSDILNIDYFHSFHESDSIFINFPPEKPKRADVNVTKASSKISVDANDDERIRLMRELTISAKFYDRFSQLLGIE